MIKTWLFIIFTWHIVACTGRLEDELKEEWVQNEVLILSSDYRLKKITECKNIIFQEAESYVDSILSDMDLFSKIIGEEIPVKPIKPKYIPLDTNTFKNHSVNPILNNATKL